MSHVTWTPLSKLKSQRSCHQAALLTAALTRQAAAAVSVGTYWPWEPTATLRSALCRRGRLGGARRFDAPEGGAGRRPIVAAVRLQLVRCAVADHFYDGARLVNIIYDCIYFHSV